MVTQFTSALLAALFCFGLGSARPRGRVTAREKRSLFLLIKRDKEFAKLVSDFSGSPGEAEELTRSSAQSLEVEKVDLNGDGRPEYIVGVGGRNDIFCGALGNCPRWVFRAAGKGFERIGYDDGSRELRPQKGTTKGYRDLRAQAGDTAVEDAVIIYKYDGRAYRASGCYTRDLSVTPVKVTPIKCSEMSR